MPRRLDLNHIFVPLYFTPVVENNSSASTDIADYTYKSVVLFFGITPFIPEHLCAKPTVAKVQSDSTSYDYNTGKTEQKLSSLVEHLGQLLRQAQASSADTE